MNAGSRGLEFELLCDGEKHGGGEVLITTFIVVNLVGIYTLSHEGNCLRYLAFYFE